MDRQQHLSETQRPSGGILLAIDKKYKIQKTIKSNDTRLEALFVHIDLISNQRQLQIVVVYQPPNQNMNEFLQRLNDFLSSIVSLDIPTMVIGDFNEDLLAKTKKTILPFFQQKHCRQIGRAHV